MMENKAAVDSICSLNKPKVSAVLDRLHGEASRQVGGLARLLALALIDAVLRRRISSAEEARRLKHIYVPTSRKQGTFLYLTARSVGARRIVEFGTSFAVSTIYLAAAVRDNGGGCVIGSEFEPTKAAKARENVAEAGLGDLVEIREGDAQETLRNPDGTVDMVFLDGHKDLYLSILKMLTPHLRKGAVVVADNIYTFRRALAPYIRYISDPRNGFNSVVLRLKDGTAYSVRL
jgi:predicted O-methyltransferase YrrM